MDSAESGESRGDRYRIELRGKFDVHASQCFPCVTRAIHREDGDCIRNPLIFIQHEHKSTNVKKMGQFLSLIFTLIENFELFIRVKYSVKNKLKYSSFEVEESSRSLAFRPPIGTNNRDS